MGTRFVGTDLKSAARCIFNAGFFVVIATGLAFEAPRAAAQSFPAKPVRWIVPFPTLEPDRAVVCHECVHLALEVLSHRGVEVHIDGSTDEAVCYYTEAMFRQIIRTLRQWRKDGR